MRVVVRAKPGARKNAVEPLPPAAGSTQPRYAVAVTAPAADGRANRAIERALAGHLGLPPSRVRIVLGFTAREKVAEILKD
ncbi:MAG TPA: DUF167 domain-containing protein [Terriglobales bacterium]|nr:DUF167 domain-containing protein [Terriglobales bacterium]